MKQHLRNIVLTAGLSVLLGSSTLNAQNHKAIANIPFAYQVGHQTFSPGEYTLERQMPGVFALQQRQTGHGIFMTVLQQSAAQKDAWDLTFSCYAGTCSLAQIQMAGDCYNLIAKPPVRAGRVAAMISIPLR
jgi:hypothetical protein